MVAVRKQKPWRQQRGNKLIDIDDMQQLCRKVKMSDELANVFRRNCNLLEADVIRTVVKDMDFTKEPVHTGFHKDPEFGFMIKRPYTLYPHQVRAIKWFLSREQNVLHGVRGGIMAAEMGLGKTLMALSILNTAPASLNLIVCNKSLMDTIAGDNKKFFDLPCCMLHPDYIKPKNLDDMNMSWFHGKVFILTTYDVVVGLAKRANIIHKAKKSSHKKSQAGFCFYGIHFNRIICDESQKFVNKSTQVFTALKQLRATSRMCLTGTPIRNYDTDLHTQLLFCGLDESIVWSEAVYEELGLSDAVYRLSIEEANITLPEKQIISVNLDFKPREQLFYDHVLQNTVQTIQCYSSRKQAITYALVLEQILRLRQVCISPTLLDSKKDTSLPPIDRTVDGLQSTKIQRVLQIINQTPQRDKIIVFSAFLSALTLLHDVLDPSTVVMVHGGTKKRDKIFDTFRSSPHVRVLLITNGVGTMGLNLTEANHVVLMETWWHHLVENQASARVWRIGQRKKVFIWKLIMNNSIEERMLDMCKSKTEMSDSFLAKNKAAVLTLFS